MTKQLLFLQGAGDDAYAEDEKLANSLRDLLGADYNVIYPPMPNPGAPHYEAWKAKIAQQLDGLKGDVILVGHSLGGSLLLKYVAEEKIDQRIAGLFLIAAPFWDAADPGVAEYALKDGFEAKLMHIPHIAFYHSRDDEWVPFAHLAMYAEKLSQAKIHEFNDRGHQFNDDLSEVARDIKNLT